MAKVRYEYDTESAQYKIIKGGSMGMIINMGINLLLAIGIACVVVVINNAYNESPREIKSSRDVKEMEFYFAELTRKVESLSRIVKSVEHRDDNIYRMVLGSQPVDHSLREGGRGGYSRYSEIQEKHLGNGDLIVALNEQVDKLRRKLYIESLSQDELVQLLATKEKQYASIPAIQPVSNGELIAIASGFGLRVDPFYKVTRMHAGIDFVANLGTSIYATADGQIVSAEEKLDGYGKMIVVDHGFGYVTRYAHLDNFNVQAGQQVKRGEQIGFVGNTGLSTAPHLHYEVLVNGLQINPVNYFFNDLNAQEYEKVVVLASAKNQSLEIKKITSEVKSNGL